MNTSVVLWLLIIGSTRAASLIPRCPAHGNFSISSGITDSISIFLSCFALIITPSCFKGASNTFFASSKFPIVADIPQMLNAGSDALSSFEAFAILLFVLEPVFFLLVVPLSVLVFDPPASILFTLSNCRFNIDDSAFPISPFFLMPTNLEIASSTCTPLLLPNNSCHSSTAIILRCLKVAG